jgi:heme exporter protein A
MLSIMNVGFSFLPPQLLFKPISFSLDEGQALHIKGKNGIGKTTLLKCLAGILHPTIGGIYLNDKPINVADIFDREYIKGVSYVDYEARLCDVLTPYELLYFSPYDIIHDKDINSLLNNIDLLKLQHINIAALSSGQRKKLAITYATMKKSTIWLFDEPFVALDEQSTRHLMRMITQFLSQGGICIFTSHDTSSYPFSVNSIELIS